MKKQRPDIYFKDAEGLQPLFIEKGAEKDQELNHTIIEKVEKQTDLIFTSAEPEAGNVCMANSEEVLPAFRTSFSIDDLLDYARGIQKSQIFAEMGTPGEIHLPYPGTSDFFWKQASLGRS